MPLTCGERTWPELDKLATGPAPQPQPQPGPTPPTTAVRVRADVWTLSVASEWHPTILWYARAVAALQARDGTTFVDPRSWRHLAETHGSVTPREQWPSGARWRQCEHVSSEQLLSVANGLDAAVRELQRRPRRGRLSPE